MSVFNFLFLFRDYVESNLLDRPGNFVFKYSNPSFIALFPLARPLLLLPGNRPRTLFLCKNTQN